MATTLSTPTPTTLLVGDALRSVILLTVANADDGTLVETGRDYAAHGTTACCGLDGSDKAFLAAEQDLNILTLAWAGENTLEAQGRFHVGELVNRLRPGRLASTAGAAGLGAGRAHTVYATSSGSLGVVCALEHETAQLASDLERNMRRVVGRGVGGLEQAECVVWSIYFILVIMLNHHCPPPSTTDGELSAPPTACWRRPALWTAALSNPSPTSMPGRLRKCSQALTSMNASSASQLTLRRRLMPWPGFTRGPCRPDRVSARADRYIASDPIIAAANRQQLEISMFWFSGDVKGRTRRERGPDTYVPGENSATCLLARRP
jgi:hypothetical protein